MPDFDPPFGQGAERRAPTTTEQQFGFPCGPLNRALFNDLFNLIEGQFKVIADEAGVNPNHPRDKTLLTRAVLALIAAALGEMGEGEGPDLSGFILMSQARNRFPIFPEILNENKTIQVTAPSTGQVRVAEDTTFRHRGIFDINTSKWPTEERTFNTDPSKEYHLRWRKADDAFVLLDLANAGYNPTSLSEGNPVFDSTFDDMLVARILTTSSNVASITSLANAHQLRLSGETDYTQTPPYEDNKKPSEITGGNVLPINWARKPRASIGMMTDLDVPNRGSNLNMTELNVGIIVDSRYRVRTVYQRRLETGQGSAAFSYEVWA